MNTYQIQALNDNLADNALSEDIYSTIPFKVLRSWAKETYGVTARSKAQLVERITEAHSKEQPQARSINRRPSKPVVKRPAAKREAARKVAPKANPKASLIEEATQELNIAVNDSPLDASDFLRIIHNLSLIHI